MRAHKRVVVVGAGLGGVAAATGLRRFGFKGSISLVNAEREIPYDRPPLSKELISGSRSREQILLHPEGFYSENDIKLLSGRRVIEIDRENGRLRMDDGEVLPYDDLVIATGSRPRGLPVAVTGTGVFSRMHYLRELGEATALREQLSARAHMLVVGAGFIGLEVAATARRLGCPVTVVEAGRRVLERAAPEVVSSFMQSRHEAEGIEFRLCSQVVGITEGSRSISLRLGSGEVVTGDLVLVGIGAVPNDEIARAAGLACDDGIVVDAQCRTEDPHVYAVGDVANAYSTLRQKNVRSEHWEGAQHMGVIAAANICGQPASNDFVPWVWSDQGDVNLQFLGWSDPSATRVVRGEPGASAWSVIDVLDGRVIGAALVNAGRDRRPLQRLIQSGTRVDPARLAYTAALKQLVV